MKTLSTLAATYLRSGKRRGNLRSLLRLLALLVALVITYSVLFHFLMAQEGKSHSWPTGFYWTMVTMSTLGFGDITFESNLGRMFSVLVLTSGTVFLLILLPFTFIQFFYAPWMEARDAARAPRQLPKTMSGHLLLTAYGPVDTALVGRLHQFRTPYAIVVPEVAEALRLHDAGIHVMVGDVDDPATYRRARAHDAALVVATQSDTMNTSIAVSVRDAAPDVPIVATAASHDAVDILTLAGCQTVLELGDMLGRFMAQRVFAGDGRSHVIGRTDGLLIAEAWAAGTTIVGSTLRDLRLRDTLGVTVAGVWERGQFELGGPETTLTGQSILLLAGTRDQLDAYDLAFGLAEPSAPAFVVVLGGGRVGQAVARALAERGVGYRIVERQHRPGSDDPHVVLGDAADLAVLKKANIDQASCVIVTTHEDDVNVFLTLYARKLKSDALILSRATLERNTRTLHRAGADFVLSYGSVGANAIFNLLRDRNVMTLAEGLNVFTVPTPAKLVGRTLVQSGLRQETGVNLLAIHHDGQVTINPEASTRIPDRATLTLIGDRAAERRFFRTFHE